MESTQNFKGEKYLPRCHYCGETFPVRKLQNHTIHCRLVLEKCPKNCGVYITRQQKDDHLSSLCEKLVLKNNLSSPNSNRSDSELLNELERNLKIIQHKVEDEKRNRLEFEYNWLKEVAKLHERCQRFEEWQERVMLMIKTLQETTLQEEQWRLKGEIELKDEVEKLSSLAKNLEMSSNKLSSQLINTKAICSTQSEKLLEHFNYWKFIQENRMASLRSLGRELEKLQADSITKSKSMLSLIDLNEVVIESQEKCTERMKTCEKDIQSFKEFLSKENVMVSSLWYQQRDQLTKLEEDFKKTDKLIRNLTLWKLSVRKRLETIEALMHSDFSPGIMNLNEFPTILYQDDLPIYSNGHLLWCITDFEYHLSESKERNVVLQSPSFYSEEYGYKMQMKLHPNGFGQWKGRHMIITLHVLNSEWDTLLQWPFKIHATVIMRDQSSFKQEINDLVKQFGTCLITKENDSSKSLQMFVPHRSLKEFAYIRNDILILEARVKVIHDVSS